MSRRLTTVLEYARSLGTSMDQGWQYTPDQLEFMLGMEKFKHDHKRPYPDCRDVLTVAHGLGYRKRRRSGDS